MLNRDSVLLEMQILQNRRIHSDCQLGNEQLKLAVEQLFLTNFSDFSESRGIVTLNISNFNANFLGLSHKYLL